MAEERTSETGTRGSGRSRKSAKSADREMDTSLDLSSSADTATAEGFVNHPHVETTELNALPDTEAVTQTPRSISSAISSAQDAISGLSREEIISNFKSYASKASDTIREQASGLRERYKDIPANSRDMGRQLFDRVDTSARANPWLSIGLAGVGALALGFVVGRVFAGSNQSSSEGAGYDFDQATDE